MRPLFIILLFISSFQVNGNNLQYFKTYSKQIELSTGTVYTITQDNEGYIWYGGDLGVFRFDGTNVVSLQNLLRKAINLPTILRMYFDGNNDLWLLGSDHRVFHIDPASKSMKIISEPKYDIFDFRQGVDKDMLIAHSNGLTKIDYYSQEEQSIFDKTVYAISNNPKLLSAFYCAGSCVYFESVNRDWEGPFRVEIGGPEIVRYMFRMDEDNLLLGYVDKGGLWIYNKKTLTLDPIIKGVSIYNITESATKSIYWIASDEGLYIYDHRRGKTLRIRTDIENPHSLVENNIRCFHADREGGMWVGTFFRGIILCPRLNSMIEYTPSSHRECYFNGSVVSAFEVDHDHNMWIATEDAGIHYYDHNLQTYEGITSMSDRSKPSTINTRCLQLVNNELWIGTLDNGIEVYDVKEKRVIAGFNKFNNCGLTSNYIIDIAKQGEELYIASYRGLHRFDRENGKLRSLLATGVQDLNVTQRGELWCASGGDIYKIDLQDSITRLDINKLSTVHQIKEVSDQTLYIVTRDNVYEIEEASSSKGVELTEVSWYNMSEKRGTPLRLESEGDSVLWLATTKGLLRYNKRKQSRAFYPNTEFFKNNSLHHSSFKSKDGTLYFGTQRGYIKVKESQLSGENHANLVVSQIQIRTRDLSIDTVFHTIPSEKVILHHQSNNLILNLTDLTYSDETIRNYTYQLIGYDESPIPFSDDVKIVYNNLASGDYTFILQNLANDNSILSSKVYEITIKPPLWKTPFALLIYLILFVFGIYLLIRWKYNRILTVQANQQVEFQRAKEKEFFNKKMRFYTNITHEIRTPITHIKLLADHMLEDRSHYTQDYLDIKAIRTLSHRLTELCGQMLKITPEEIDTMIYERFDTTLFLKETIDPYVQNRNSSRVKFTIDCDSIVADVDKDVFQKMIVNLITNALKYALSFVHVEMRREDAHFTILFVNDGEKIPIDEESEIFTPFFRASNRRSKKGDGLGLSIVKQLAELHGGKIELLKGNYTRFLLTLPLTQQKVFEPIVLDDEVVDPQYSALWIEGRDTILIVEDDKQLREYEARLLARNYNVLVAHNGVKALEVIDTYPIALVISDVMMDEMDGIELCARVKQSSKNHHIPFILLTAKECNMTREKAFTVGVDEYFTKPYSMHQLNCCIAQYLTKKREVYTSDVCTKYKELVVDRKETEQLDFLQRFYTIVDDHLSNNELNIDFIADTMRVSRSSLYKKITKSIDISPNDYIRVARMKRAGYLLAVKKQRIKEVAFNVGFSSTTYFATIFVKHYGVSPTEYVKQQQTKE